MREKPRDRRLFAILIVAALVSLAAAFTTAVALERKVEARAAANTAELNRWLNQNAKFAHSAAHYGVYVFKPLSTLAAIEPGIEKFVGTSTWLEAHKQNEFIYRPAQDELSGARRAALTPSFVITVIAPLAMLFLGDVEDMQRNQHHQPAHKRARGTICDARLRPSSDHRRRWFVLVRGKIRRGGSGCYCQIGFCTPCVVERTDAA